ncbi:DUF6882 domain-containing protein [Nocardia sp. NPDC088792]|uniref:DUF6882 domain-containing protein n=1 Tax=Nocardia sp. NPDC088792 TaxID=3364332 RepID=UPI0038003A27
MAEAIALADLLDDAALFSYEHQLHLADVLGEHSWNVDLNEGRFAFETEFGTKVCTDFHLLGSAAPGPSSWLWSWANPSGYSEEVVGLARSLRNFGIAHDVDELADEEVPFDAFWFEEPTPALVAGAMMEAAKVLSGRWTSYSGGVNAAGTRAAFLVEHPDFQLPPPSGARVMRVLNAGLAEIVLRDHRRALHSYLSRRGLNPTFTADLSHLTFDHEVIGGTIDFDDLGRASALNMRLSGGQ